jgi:N-acetylglucosaminyldiphosphoundecaprenol N-acetyl-beta-D-mannosaminyltransferase
MRINILGVGFDDITAEQAVLKAIDTINGVEKMYVVTPNPEIVWMARRDEKLRDALNGAGMLLPDGIGIIIGARILGTPLHGGRVPGIDFAESLFDTMSASGKSVFLLGAKPGIAEEAGQKLAEKYPGLKISGTSDGYFADDGPVIEKINSARPDVLLVCLGSPKQELFMTKNLVRLDVKLCAGLGGSLDVFAGKVKRAPVVFQKLGLEWLFRLIREPRRIKRMIKLPLFILVLIWKRVTGKRRG